MTDETTPPALAKRLERWLSLRAYGLFTSTLFRPDTAPKRMRARFERYAYVPRERMLRQHPQLSFEDHAIGRLAMERVLAVPAPRCAILHLHGGAFVMGSPASYRNRAMRLSYRCNAEVFVPDYRLAPEQPFPAALDDALAAYQYLCALRPALPIILSGDSAGGGLVLSLLARLRDRRQRMPAGAILLSPWADLSTVQRTPRCDLWLTPAHLEHWAAHYAGAHDRTDPELSPALADLSGLPPLLVLAGEDEILLDDAVRLTEAALRVGTEARLIVGRGMQHDWPLTLPWLAESRAAWRAMQAFVEERCADATAAEGCSSVPARRHSARAAR